MPDAREQYDEVWRRFQERQTRRAAGQEEARRIDPRVSVSLPRSVLLQIAALLRQRAERLHNNAGRQSVQSIGRGMIESAEALERSADEIRAALDNVV